MHAVFILYGIKDAVDMMLRDMQSQKFLLECTSPDGKEKRYQWMQGSLRFLPGGIYDYVFPKEYQDEVLTELRFNTQNMTLTGVETAYTPFNIYKEFSFGLFKIKPLNALKKALNLQDVPDFKKYERNLNSHVVWITDNVSIIPIGIKPDGVVTESKTAPLADWTHEAI